MECPQATGINTGKTELCETDRQVYRLAAQTLLALQAADVPPTPRHFELWFTHLGGSNADLSHRLEALISAGGRISGDALDLLHAECLALHSHADAATLEDGADAIQQAAEEAVEQLTAGQRSLQKYGAVLSQMGFQLGQDQTLDNLVKTVAILTAETVRASEHNRALEQRLTASAARISRLRQSLAEVKEEATTDALTGLINRRGFDTRLRRAVVRAKTDETPVCLLVADVDHFKQFNDSYGHKTGDLVLRLVGRLLADNVKGKDTAARFGGEEFAIILTGADERAGGRVAEQIRAALDGKRLINRGSGQNMRGVTISVGVAAMEANESATALLGRADVALYRAKKAGRNRVWVSSQADETVPA